MPETTEDRLKFPHRSGFEASGDMLTEVLRRGALDLLVQAVQAEVAQWIDDRVHLTDEQGHRQGGPQRLRLPENRRDRRGAVGRADAAGP